jgi:hypothetical protein
VIRVCEPTLSHLLARAVALPPGERELAEALSGEPYDPGAVAAKLKLAPGMHFAFLSENEHVIAAGGFITHGNGVFRTWFLASEASWEHYGVELTRVVRELIRRMLYDGPARRIETVTLADRTRARDWYPKIGLTYESTMQAYGAQGQDAVMYVAVKKTES